MPNVKNAARIWRVRDRQVDLSTRGLIMGILNVTPDSFSDGGKFQSPGAALQRGLEMVVEGAEILDVGGESTRPGADPVPEAVEVARVIPVIEALRQQTQVILSVDTMKPVVARAALEAGADVINDVGGFRDPEMIRVAQEFRAGCVVMHMQGEPRTMQQAPHYADVVGQVRQFFSASLTKLIQHGVAPEQILWDPGIGFGKALEHNLELLRRLPELAVRDRPMLVGVSRKSFLGSLLGSRDMEAREWPTVALTSLLREKGAAVLRVHSVRPNVEALRMTEAILSHA